MATGRQLVSDVRSIDINCLTYLHKCSKCGILKPNTEYSPSPNKRANNNIGRKFVSSCKSCRNKYSGSKTVLERRKITAPLLRKKNRMSSVYSASVGNAKKRNLEHNFNIEYLKELYANQKGLCYYTDQPMLLDIREANNNYNSISLDRIDSSKGYIKGNVVLCRWVVNKMKNDVPFHGFLKIISDINTKFNVK